MHDIRAYLRVLGGKQVFYGRAVRARHAGVVDGEAVGEKLLQVLVLGLLRLVLQHGLGRCGEGGGGCGGGGAGGVCVFEWTDVCVVSLHTYPAHRHTRFSQQNVTIISR